VKRDEKKQYFAMFILIMFLGSTLAYALMSVFVPETEEKKLLFEGPLLSEDEAVYFRQNMIVLRYYYQPDDETSQNMFPVVKGMIDELGGKIIIEKIDIDEYKEVYENVESRIDFDEEKSLPTILLRGYTEELLQGEVDSDTLFEKACSLYFEEIDECFLAD